MLRTPLALLAASLVLLAADRVFAPYSSIPPLLSQGPPELRSADESSWLAWAARHDREIRARLDQGDLDSLVNLLLYGTSFTTQPRISMEGEGIAQASKSGVLRARVNDLAAGLRNPADNDRLIFLRRLLRKLGIDPEGSDGPRQTGVFILQNLQRVVEERKTLANRAGAKPPAPPDDPASLLDRSSLFRDRGLSLDTGIFPDYSVEHTLRDLKQQGVLREGQVTRVAVIGPGLDFIDKTEASAFDYYPEQTLQPFALYDSLVRLRLAKAGALSMSIFDISAQVIEHIRRARERAKKNIGYVIQLPRDAALPVPPDLNSYWKSLGDQVGTAIAPITPPRIFQGLDARAVQVRPDVVLACEPIDLDIILQRLNLAPLDRFDLIIATNIFVYYDSFEQALALENAGAMLKPGGLLLTNDRLPSAPGGSMRLAGITVVPYDSSSAGRQAVGWYRKD
jgi:SAM-dependent methyltransferase